jgi:hypothetical protein
MGFRAPIIGCEGLTFGKKLRANCSRSPQGANRFIEDLRQGDPLQKISDFAGESVLLR